MDDFHSYDFIRRIGKGAEGSVWLVSHPDYVDESLVLKKIWIGSRSEKSLGEARILKLLKHKHVIKYYASFFDDLNEHLCIVTDYCSGGNLDDRIQRTKQEGHSLSEGQIMEWFGQILLAMNYIHNNKILHRDLKTANIFLTGSNIIKVGDFGIAAQLENSCDMRRTCVGSPYYMSPEVCQDIPYNSKSDIWAMGCVLYEMCALTQAFSGGNLLFLVTKICSCKYEPIPEGYSSELYTLIQSLLQANPEKRPSASALIKDLSLESLIENSRPGTRVGKRRSATRRSLDENAMDTNADDFSEQEPHRAKRSAKSRRSRARSSQANSRKQDRSPLSHNDSNNMETKQVEVLTYRHLSDSTVTPTPSVTTPTTDTLETTLTDSTMGNSDVSNSTKASENEEQSVEKPLQVDQFMPSSQSDEDDLFGLFSTPNTSSDLSTGSNFSMDVRAAPPPPAQPPSQPQSQQPPPRSYSDSISSLQMRQQLSRSHSDMPPRALQPTNLQRYHAPHFSSQPQQDMDPSVMYQRRSPSGPGLSSLSRPKQSSSSSMRLRSSSVSESPPSHAKPSFPSPSKSSSSLGGKSIPRRLSSSSMEPGSLPPIEGNVAKSLDSARGGVEMRSRSRSSRGRGGQMDRTRWSRLSTSSVSSVGSEDAGNLHSLHSLSYSHQDELSPANNLHIPQTRNLIVLSDSDDDDRKEEKAESGSAMAKNLTPSPLSPSPELPHGSKASSPTKSKSKSKSRGKIAAKKALFKSSGMPSRLNTASSTNSSITRPKTRKTASVSGSLPVARSSTRAAKTSSTSSSTSSLTPHTRKKTTSKKKKAPATSGKPSVRKYKSRTVLNIKRSGAPTPYAAATNYDEDDTDHEEDDNNDEDNHIEEYKDEFGREMESEPKSKGILQPQPVVLSMPDNTSRNAVSDHISNKERIEWDEFFDAALLNQKPEKTMPSTTSLKKKRKKKDSQDKNMLLDAPTQDQLENEKLPLITFPQSLMSSFSQDKNMLLDAPTQDQLENEKPLLTFPQSLMSSFSSTLTSLFSRSGSRQDKERAADIAVFEDDFHDDDDDDDNDDDLLNDSIEERHRSERPKYHHSHRNYSNAHMFSSLDYGMEKKKEHQDSGSSTDTEIAHEDIPVHEMEEDKGKISILQQVNAEKEKRVAEEEVVPKGDLADTTYSMMDTESEGDEEEDYSEDESDTDEYDLVEALAQARIAIESRAEDYEEEDISDEKIMAPWKSVILKECVDTLGEDGFEVIFEHFSNCRDSHPEMFSTESDTDNSKGFRILPDNVRAVIVSREVAAITKNDIQREAAVLNIKDLVAFDAAFRYTPSMSTR